MTDGYGRRILYENAVFAALFQRLKSALRVLRKMLFLVIKQTRKLYYFNIDFTIKCCACAVRRRHGCRAQESLKNGGEAYCRGVYRTDIALY
jgi:hypothetical protein